MDGLVIGKHCYDLEEYEKCEKDEKIILKFPRTSLEFCKLLLSLDPEGDPLAVVLFIDFYALRAKEYEWFVEFCNLWENSRNLTQLPNIAYSLALTHFRLGNRADADELLQKALIMFPGVLMLLLEKCSIQTDTKVLNLNIPLKNSRAPPFPKKKKMRLIHIYFIICIR